MIIISAALLRSKMVLTWLVNAIGIECHTADQLVPEDSESDKLDMPMAMERTE